MVDAARFLTWILANKHFLNKQMCLRHMCIRLSIVLAIFKWISILLPIVHTQHTCASDFKSIVLAIFRWIFTIPIHYTYMWIWSTLQANRTLSITGSDCQVRLQKLLSTCASKKCDRGLSDFDSGLLILTTPEKPLERKNVFFLQTCWLLNACCHVEACKCPSASHASFVWSLSDRVVVEWVDLTILKLTANQPSNVASRQQVDCGRWDPLNYFKIVICPIFRGIILQQRQYARARSREGNGW